MRRRLITINEKLNEIRPAAAKLVLPFEQRTKSRLLAQLDSGEEVGLTLKRGTILRGGDLLLSSDGRVVEVVAASESVSVVRSDDLLQLARAAYHLGNRHVSVQIGPGWLRYQRDHVLDEMVRGLGLPVVEAPLPFEPEGGAYAPAAHTHFIFAEHRDAAHPRD